MGMLNPFPHTPPKELELRVASYETEVHNWKSEVRTFPQECLIVAQGFGPDSTMIATEIADTALLAYKIQRRKLFYWEFRERLVSQMITITARKLIRLPITTATRQGSLAVLAFSDRNWWLGVVGESILFLQRNNEQPLEINTRTRSSSQLLGQTKKITPFLTSGESRAGDWYCVQTSAILSKDIFTSAVETVASTDPTALIAHLQDVISHASAQTTAVAVVYKTFV